MPYLLKGVHKNGTARGAKHYLNLTALKLFDTDRYLAVPFLVSNRIKVYEIKYAVLINIVFCSFIVAYIRIACQLL